MAVYVVNHTVANYEEWKKAYDAFQDRAGAAGINDQYVLTSLTDPNHVVVVGEGTAEAVQAFLGSDELKSTMEAAGVTGKPDIFVGENNI
jgi:hypothetical protein